MFHSGWVHTCNTCKGQWDFGFFNNKNCPKCTGIGKQILSLIGRIIRMALILGVPFALVYACDRDLGAQIANRALRIVDSRTLYTYGRDAYLSEIWNDGGMGYFTLRSDVQAYPSPVARGKERDAAIAYTLKKKSNVIIGQKFRFAGDYWAPAEFYVGASMRRAFILVDKPDAPPWSGYDIVSRRNLEQKSYEAYVLKNFATIEKAALSDDEAKARGLFALTDIEPPKGGIAYAAISDKGEIAKAKKWYTAERNIDMMALQQDREFTREPLALKSSGTGEM